MDTKIQSGDAVLIPSGEAVYIEGAEEVFQQMLMLITLPRGGFIYNKDFGFEAVCGVSGERELRKTEAQLRETIAPIKGATLYLISAEELIDGSKKLQLSLGYGENTLTKEVII